jgi:N-acetyl-alpha-D-muramate 1-phosphate uridylyltransferase
MFRRPAGGARQSRLNVRFLVISDISRIPVALLCGGLATRLGAITRAVPKALVDVAGRPFIDHQLDLLQRTGVRQVVLCVGHLGEQIQQHVGDGSSRGLIIRYSYDGDAPVGTGGALRWAAPMLGEVFWVMYGDSYMEIDYRAVLEYFAASEALGLMTVIRNNDRWDRSNVIFRDQKLLRYDKTDRSPEMNFIDYGVQLLTRRAITRIPIGAKADLADLYRQLVSERKMVGFEVKNRFYEIGTPQALEETRRYLQGEQPRSDAA